MREPRDVVEMLGIVRQLAEADASGRLFDPPTYDDRGLDTFCACCGELLPGAKRRMDVHAPTCPWRMAAELRLKWNEAGLVGRAPLCGAEDSAITGGGRHPKCNLPAGHVGWYHEEIDAEGGVMAQWRGDHRGR